MPSVLAIAGSADPRGFRLVAQRIFVIQGLVVLRRTRQLPHTLVGLRAFQQQWWSRWRCGVCVQRIDGILRMSQLRRHGRIRFQELFAKRNVRIALLDRLQVRKPRPRRASSRAWSAPTKTARIRAALYRFLLCSTTPAPASSGFSSSRHIPRPAPPRAPQIFPVFFVANAASLSYEPGAAVCRSCARSAICFCSACSSGVVAELSGTVVVGRHPPRQGAGLGLVGFLRRGVVCEGRVAVCEGAVVVCAAAWKGAPTSRDKLNTHAASGRISPLKRLAARCRRSVGIFAERVGIAFGKDFHHPAVKVVHRVVHDRSESSVVLAMCFFNVVFQSDAEIAIFAALLHLLWPQHLYILHRNLGHAVRPAVQLLLFGGQAIDVEIIAEHGVAGNRGSGSE